MVWMGQALKPPDEYWATAAAIASIRSDRKDGVEVARSISGRV